MNQEDIDFLISIQDLEQPDFDNACLERENKRLYKQLEIKDLILKALHKYFTEHEHYEEDEILRELESCTDEDIIWLKRMAGEE